MKRKLEILSSLFVSLFPNLRAYFNFMLLWIFFFVLISIKEPQIVIVSALGVGYFFNEWSKAITIRRVLNE